ncbi:MAG: hypothetical protein AB1704_21040 [Pseudomonadota bacterium]|jgi:hypothetical protein|uniref:hypothetical protein n=1 Tax=Burkholderiaceae TaxID=119060 RepID=UPI0010F49FE5|nr:MULTISPECIES: hypothetical protein [Burkholderiaceae]WCM20069.1 hypothetical protein NDK50_00890 [Paraburkholderia bryophila]
MQRHHEAQLRQLFDEVFLVGTATVPWDQLYMWLGVKRMTKGPWRELHQLWAELCDSQGFTKPLDLILVSQQGPTQSRAIFRRRLHKSEVISLVADLAA